MDVKSFKLEFGESHRLRGSSVRLVQGKVGLYFIFLKDVQIPYPFESSRLIYIGMSESRQNGIGGRLRAHMTGQSGNEAISNYCQNHAVLFTHHTQDLLSVIGTNDLFELESLFLSEFRKEHGAYPICNNQSGQSAAVTETRFGNVEISWTLFA